MPDEVLPELLEETCRDPGLCPRPRGAVDKKTARVLDRLLYYLSLTDSPCPVGRHELKNQEWILIQHLRIERDRLNMPSKTPLPSGGEDG